MAASKLVLTNPEREQCATGEFGSSSAGCSFSATVDSDRHVKMIGNFQRERKRAANLMPLYAAWVGAAAIVVGIKVQGGFSLNNTVFLLEALVLAAFGLILAGEGIIGRFRYNAALTALLKDNTKHNIPTLIHLAPHLVGKRSHEVKARLARLLLSLEPTDRILSQADFGRLHAMLRWPDVALVCAILSAIENVGSLDSLPAVTRLARGRMLARNVPAVKHTAILCMEALSDQMADKSYIGGTLRLMGRRDTYEYIRHDARRSLIAMFPHLSADDRHLFKNEERRLLYLILETRDVELILATLRMLPIVGLLDALPHVSAVAAGRNRTNRNIVMVRDRARACQASLGGRLQVLESHNYLLRSSSSTPEWRNQLVNATFGPGSSNPDELIRPADVANEGQQVRTH